MFLFENNNKFTGIRYSTELIESYANMILQKRNHDFFSYKCNEYQSISHLCECQKFNISKIDKEIIKICEEYWSSMDLIHFEIENIPNFKPTKEFFDEIRIIQRKEKFVKKINFYEVKSGYGKRKPILSVKTMDLYLSLKKCGKKLNLIYIKIEGKIKFISSFIDMDPSKFKIDTHYARKGFHIGTSVRIEK